jgi:ketosteroid isomerase-like protein
VDESLSNRKVAQAFFEEMNNRSHHNFEKYLSEGAAFDFPGAGRIEGRRRIISFVKVLFRKFPRLVFSIKDMIVEGDRACIVWTNEGERVDGTLYKNKGVTLLQISDGKIDFVSDYFKDTSFVS